MSVMSVLKINNKANQGQEKLLELKYPVIP